MPSPDRHRVELEPPRHLTLSSEAGPILLTIDAANRLPEGGDARIEARIGLAQFRTAMEQRQLGLDPALRTDPPAPAADGSVWIELRPMLSDERIEPGTLPELLDRLVDADDDPLLDASSWVTTRIGAADGGRAPQATVWHHLPSDAAAPTPADAVAAVAAFLREGAPDPGAAEGLDVAAALLVRWFGAGHTDGALRLAAGDVDDVGRHRGVADHLRSAWDVLVDDEVDPTAVDDGHGIVFAVDAPDTRWHAVIEQRDDDTLVVHSLSPVELPDDRIVECIELVLRLNLGLARSAFDLDLDTGELALRTGVDLGAADDIPTAIRRTIRSNVHTFGDHLAVLEAFAAGADVASSLALLDDD